ncbi:MAG TPA: hypothetical protein VHO84_12310 [Syntrophorhabdaceae bacterium]|nr:hypothetical protein [Syntrophorhabdaceae bacterium]
MVNCDSSLEKTAENSLRGPMILSRISLLLMFVESIIGLFLPGTYARDNTWGRAVFLGNDLVNLCLFTPLLIIALILLKRGTDKGKVFWLGIQALITYDYIYYPLAVAYNDYFLLYVVILGVSLYSFIFGINSLDLSSYRKYIPAKRVKVAASILLLAFAAVFVFLWIGRYISFLMTGKLDMDGVSMISTFDLITLAVPLVLSAIWLLKGEGRGYVLSIVMGLICGLYSFILIAYTPYALKANLSDAWTMLPFWIFTAVLGLAPALILLMSKPSD